MENKEKYYYNDFTYDNYRKLIRLAKNSYIFRFYNNFIKDEKFILWRHDVDISPQSALILAHIEKEEGVLATYFFHLHSRYYNLFEDEIMSIVFKIIEMGHAIGLHFEPDISKTENDIVFIEKLVLEKTFLENIFNCEIFTFSIHNPSEFIIKKFTAYRYASLVNTYSSYFQNEVGYCSDSNGYWRHRRLEDVLRLADDERLQVLTHPAWWQDKAMSPHDKIKLCIDGRAAKQHKRYDDIMAKLRRNNVR